MVGSALHVVDPLLVIQIPLYGFADTGFKSFLRLPSKLTAHLGRIDGIAAIVAGAIRHIGDLLTIRARFWHHLVQQIADGVYHLQILLLVVTADVVGLPDHAGGHHLVESARVVFHIEPVTDLVALAIDRQRLAIQRVEDDQRDQLLGEVVRAVVVGAVGDDGRQTVSAAPGAHQMVTGGFGGRIGAARGVRRCFGEKR